MSEQQTTDAAQAAAAAGALAATTAAAEAEALAAAEAAAAGDDTATGDAVSAAEKKARAEAKNLRTRAKDAEAERDRLKAIVDAGELEKLSDIEKANKLAADAETKANEAQKALRDARLETAVTLAATAKGVSPELAIKLIGDVKFDDAGKPVGVAEAVAELVKTHPNLVTSKGGPGAGGAPGAAAPGAQPQNESRYDFLKRMKVY